MSKGPFKLRSGNSPLFKKMGSANTPAYLKEFGVGKGTSPYEQEEEEGGKWKKALKKGASTLFAGFTSGLDAVYGTGKVMPEGSAKFSFSKKKKEDDDKETKVSNPSDEIKSEILDDKE